eukprot:gene3110-3388_t
MFGPGHDNEDDKAYDEDGEGDDDEDEDAKWWPKCAKHSATDFKEFFNRNGNWLRDPLTDYREDSGVVEYMNILHENSFF